MSEPRKTNIEIAEDEAKLLAQLLDVAQRAQGIQVSGAVVFWLAKLEKAFPPVSTAAPVESKE